MPFVRRDEFPNGVSNGLKQFPGIEWFFDEIVGAFFNRLNPQFQCAVTGNHDDWNLWMLLPDNLQKLHAVHFGHL